MEEANGVIKNNSEKEGPGHKAQNTVNGKTTAHNLVIHQERSSEPKSRTLRVQGKIVRNKSCEDDLSSSSTFSESEDHIPHFLAEMKENIEF